MNMGIAINGNLELNLEMKYIGVSLDIENYCTVGLFFEQAKSSQ